MKQMLCHQEVLLLLWKCIDLNPVWKIGIQFQIKLHAFFDGLDRDGSGKDLGREARHHLQLLQHLDCQTNAAPRSPSYAKRQHEGPESTAKRRRGGPDA